MKNASEHSRLDRNNSASPAEEGENVVVRASRPLSAGASRSRPECAGKMLALQAGADGIGSGVFEIALPFRGDIFRAIHAVQLDDICVIHPSRRNRRRASKRPNATWLDRLKRLKELVAQTWAQLALLCGSSSGDDTGRSRLRAGRELPLPADQETRA